MITLAPYHNINMIIRQNLIWNSCGVYPSKDYF